MKYASRKALPHEKNEHSKELLSYSTLFKKVYSESHNAFLGMHSGT